MTPKQRAEWLIKECGTVESAKSHVAWVLNGDIKQKTKEYWQQVLSILKERK